VNILKINIKTLPLIETLILGGAILLSYTGLILIAIVSENIEIEGSITHGTIVLALFGFFIISFAIGILSIIAGIGGGIIFTPIMLAFTGVDSLIVRGTGLIVVMFSGLMSTGILIKKGIGNYKLSLVMLLSQSTGALIGSIIAVNVAGSFGTAGEAFLRLSLGVILLGIAIYFYTGSKKLDWPEIKKVDKFSKMLNLGMSYYEESEKVERHYKVTRIGLGIFFIFIIGLMGGFFGIGGGWAITPVLNMGMGLPLKVAVANSGIILGIGSCVSIWPYIFAGSLIPLFVLPWLSGQVTGGFAGTYILAKIKVSIVRIILIGIMFFTSFVLTTKALTMLGVIKTVSPLFQVIIFGIIMGMVVYTIRRKGKINDNFKKEKQNKVIIKENNEVIVNKIKIPFSCIIYSEILRWITIVSTVLALLIPILILLKPNSNLLNPNLILGAIFSGASISEIWGMSLTGIFPGAHYCLTNLTRPDSWASLSINLGCSVALWAIIPAVFFQLFKEKDNFSAVLGFIFASLLFLSIIGFLSIPT